MSNSETISILSEIGMNCDNLSYIEERERKRESKLKLLNSFFERKAKENNIEISQICSFYPTDAHYKMALANDTKFSKLIGNCPRSTYFKILNLPISNPDNIVGVRRMNIGKIIEDVERSYIKKTNCLKAANKKFVLYIDKLNYVVSGEIDMIIQQNNFKHPNLSTINIPDTILEVKTFYGYNARKEIFGNKSQEGSPKIEHINQVFLYLLAVNAPKENVLWFTEKVDANGNTFYIEDENLNFKTRSAVIYYIDRGDCDSIEHTLNLKEDNNLLINHVKNINIYNLIIDNYNKLAINIRNKTLPSRLSQYKYNSNQTSYMINNGLVSKTKALEFQKNKCSIGDYQCLYCKWKTACLGATPWEEDTIPKDDVLLEWINNILKEKNINKRGSNAFNIKKHI